MRIVTEVNTMLSIRDEYGRVTNQQILICGKSGSAKTLCGMGIAEKFQKSGFTTIFIADPKQEIEAGFSQFPPIERYQLEHLKAIGKEPGVQKVKLYHPFTFSISNKRLPEYNFFTIPIKDLGSKEWGLIAETHYQSDAVNLLLKASQEISNEDGLYGFMHYVADSVKGKSEGKRKKSDPNNFHLDTSSGTVKEIRTISSYLQPFKQHYFLSKKNSLYNLDWKKILTDQEHYHVFVTNFIQRENYEKVIDFVVLYLLESILRNKEYLKGPILIVVPEIRRLCPFKPIGYKEFLSFSIKDALSVMRGTGRGMSSILDSQVWGDVDKDIKDSATVTLLGELPANDIDEISKKWSLKKETKEFLKKPPKRNSFIIPEEEERGAFTIFLPKSMHKEESYNFQEMYERHNRQDPEKYPMRSYADVISSMKKDFKDEDEKFRTKIKKREKEELERELKEKAEREAKATGSEKVEEKKSKVKQESDKNKERLMKMCYDLKNDSNVDKKERTNRKIGEKLEIHHVTVGKYIEEYQKRLESQGPEIPGSREIKEETIDGRGDPD